MSNSAFISILCLFFTINIHASAQETLIQKGKAARAMEFGISDLSLFDALMPTMPGIGNNDFDILKEQSVKSYMMPPRKLDKPGEESYYALASLLEFYFNFDNNFKDNLSPDYIRLASSGKDLTAALKFLSEGGTVSAAIMPYEATAISTAVFATKKYKISNYLHIIRRTSGPQQKIFEAKKALVRGNPVLVELSVPEGFSTLKTPRFYKAFGQKLTEKVTLILVGFNGEEECFEFYGNWGREWGENGYMKMDYAYFANNAQNAFVLIPEK